MRYAQPFSTILFARMGSGVGTSQLMKMVAGVVNPGRPVANLYVSSNFFTDKVSWLSLNTKKFSMWSHDVISTSLTLAADLKIGQYLKVPPRVMFLTQLWGTLIG
jgi:ABC-type antimicrobial peptide transport system ATPase subunit